MRRARALLVTALLGSALVLGCAAPQGMRGTTVALDAAPFTVALPGEGLMLEMVPIPGGEVDGKEVAPFWISKLEVSWDAFDLFLYGAEPGTDAVTRPSVPYISMDRGFGHEGWPVLSLSAKGAQAFCDWLTAVTGATFRLPAEREWQHACGPLPSDLDAHAWHKGNAGGKTQRMGTKLANAHGVHDMLGNVAEWCVAEGGRRVVAGGSFRTAPGELSPATRQKSSPAWNASDPQIPKSVWWLADAGFVGLRVVCDAPPSSPPSSRP